MRRKSTVANVLSSVSHKLGCAIYRICIAIAFIWFMTMTYGSMQYLNLLSESASLRDYTFALTMIGSAILPFAAGYIVKGLILQELNEKTGVF